MRLRKDKYNLIQIPLTIYSRSTPDFDSLQILAETAVEEALIETEIRHDVQLMTDITF